MSDPSGLQFRTARDLGKITLYRAAPRARVEAATRTPGRWGAGRISPAHSENINFLGSIDVDLDAGGPNWPGSVPPAAGRGGPATPFSDSGA